MKKHIWEEKREATEMDILELMDRMDRRYIFLGLIILCFAPLLFPFKLPVPIEKASRMSYQAFESLPPRSVICIQMDYSGSSAAELYPQNLVAVKHAYKKDFRVILMAQNAMAPQLANRIFIESGYAATKRYGVDYVNLGYNAGGEAAMAVFARDTWSAFPYDYYRTPVENIPLMKDVRSLKDIGLMIFTTASSQDVYIRQYTGQGTPVIGHIQSLYYSVMETYLSAGQIVGYLNGLKGTAEYELLVDRPGAGLVSMDQASATHFYAIALIIVGNIGYFAKKRLKKKEAQKNG